MELIKRYFPELTDNQIEILSKLFNAYKYWNEKINVISRKDFENFYKHHVLHSMGVAKFISFSEGTSILDVGTGGGFPGIPLALLFPECEFFLIDSIKKKIKVIEAIKEEFDLKNIHTLQVRVEKYTEKHDFVVSRAVKKFPVFVNWVSNNIKDNNQNKVANGIIYLKGGNIDNEIEPFKDKIKIIPLDQYFQEEFFQTKKILYLPFS
ncbi:MAG: 16S rRNA (guanine(527)-N(7))-methyltransferase RsmG [Bacteroidales bacterium]